MAPSPNQRTSLLRLTKSPWTAHLFGRFANKNGIETSQISWWFMSIYGVSMLCMCGSDQTSGKNPENQKMALCGQGVSVCVCVCVQRSVYNSSQIESWIMLEPVYSSKPKKLTLETLRDTFSRIDDFSKVKLLSRQVATNCLPFVLRKCHCSGRHHGFRDHHISSQWFRSTWLYRFGFLWVALIPHHGYIRVTCGQSIQKYLKSPVQCFVWWLSRVSPGVCRLDVSVCVCVLVVNVTFTG